MEKHYDQYATPLLFHKFFWYISLPLSFIGGAFQLFVSIKSLTFSMLYLPDVVSSLIGMVLVVLCFVGFFGWKAYAWYSVIILLSLNILFSLITVILSALVTPQQLGTQLIGFVVALIYGILVGIYYIKRRELFFL